MRAFAILSLAIAGSALAWPSQPRHAAAAREFQTRQVSTPKAPVSATWFASWHADRFPLSSVSWSKYTTVMYSFALTTEDVNAVTISDPEVFKDFVATAHANGCAASISVGGWTGSRFFSPAVATAENRTAFVKTMTSLVQDNDLDGLDFDWEYPNAAGIGCNALAPNDTSNFLAFLTELRTALPGITISAATSTSPFLSADGTPSTDVSAFASVFDYIFILAYDIWGPWSDSVGPNSPLNDTCAAPAQQVGSAARAVDAWTKAGMPADQVALAVAAYGRGYTVTQDAALSADGAVAAYPAFDKSRITPGDAWDLVPAVGEVDPCGTPVTQSGVWTFAGMINGGFLNKNGTANTAAGIAYRLDECSQTPYVYNKTSSVMVSFEDATSFAAKGSYIKSLGLRGFSVWEAGGDSGDILLDSIRSAAGITNAGKPSEPTGSATASFGTSATASVIASSVPAPTGTAMAASAVPAPSATVNACDAN